MSTFFCLVRNENLEVLFNQNSFKNMKCLIKVWVFSLFTFCGCRVPDCTEFALGCYQTKELSGRNNFSICSVFSFLMFIQTVNLKKNCDCQIL